MFFTFLLRKVLFATAACKFGASDVRKVLRNWRVLYIFTSKRAFRHSGVQFLISPLSSYLRTRRFNRPTFGLTRHTNHWKNTAFRDFSNIWHGCIFFLLTFALLHLLSADLTTLLCFSTVHIVGSFYLNFLRLYMSYISRLCLQQNSHHHQQKRIKRQQHHHLHQHQQQWQQEEQQHSNGNSKNKNKNKNKNKKKKKKKKTKTKQIKWQT